jgi:hypothetical protein
VVEARDDVNLNLLEYGWQAVAVAAQLFQQRQQRLCAYYLRKGSS